MRFHEVIHSVYFDDLDAFQILHNARHLLLLERTIGDFWRRMGMGGPLQAVNNPDQYHLVRVNHFEYHHPVRDVTEVRVRIWIERLGRSSLTFAFRMLAVDEELAYATGHRVLVRVDSESKAPVAWSEAFREIMAPYRADITDQTGQHHGNTV
ncbi:MAG: thioesterase family protein [Myxococcota bacterium]